MGTDASTSSAQLVPRASRTAPRLEPRSVRLKHAYELALLRSFPTLRAGKLVIKDAGWRQKVPNLSGWSLPHPLSTPVDQWPSNGTGPWMDAGARVVRCTPEVNELQHQPASPYSSSRVSFPQIDFDHLRLNTDAKLTCPACERPTLEGGGHCTQLRVVYGLDTQYLYYNRLKCSNCPKNKPWASLAADAEEDDDKEGERLHQALFAHHDTSG
jgi:hypothetical protein